MNKGDIDNTARIDGELLVDGPCSIGGNTILKGKVKLGKGVRIANNVVVYGPTRIKDSTFIGDNSIIGHPIRSDLKKYIKTGKIEDILASDGCNIGEETIIRGGAIIYANSKIGDQVEFTES